MIICQDKQVFIEYAQQVFTNEYNYGRSFVRYHKGPYQREIHKVPESWEVGE